MATVNNPEYLHSAVEHAFCFDRENGDLVNFSLEHAEPFGPIPVATVTRYDDPAIPEEHGVVYFGLDEPARALCLVIYQGHDEDPREEITLSYAEAQALRDLLNRPEIQHILSNS